MDQNRNHTGNIEQSYSSSLCKAQINSYYWFNSDSKYKNLEKIPRFFMNYNNTSGISEKMIQLGYSGNNNNYFLERDMFAPAINGNDIKAKFQISDKSFRPFESTNFFIFIKNSFCNDDCMKHEKYQSLRKSINDNIHKSSLTNGHDDHSSFSFDQEYCVFNKLFQSLGGSVGPHNTLDGFNRLALEKAYLEIWESSYSFYDYMLKVKEGDRSRKNGVYYCGEIDFMIPINFGVSYYMFF
jgi:hypothetical protein